MANWQVISLDTTTPQLRAPGTGDGYSFNSGSTQLGVWTTTGLGIGTTSPAQRLDVAGNARILNSGADSQLIITAPTDAYAPYVRWAVSGIRDSGILGFPPADDALVYRSQANSFSTGTERFRITVAGNVGIGTASPQTRLEVQAAVNTDPVRISAASNTNGSYQGILFTQGVYQKAAIRGYSTGATDAGSLTFWTSPAGDLPNLRATLDSSGNLLVGTTTTSYDTGKVGSTHKFLNVQATTSLYAVNTVAGNQSAAGNRLGLFAFVNDTNSATYKYSAWVLSETEGSTANQLGARIVLSTTGDASAAGPIERARVDAKGNVVVNTAAVATTATDGFLYIPGCAGTPTGTPTAYTGRVPLVVDTTNNKLYFYSSGAWRDAGP